LCPPHLRAPIAAIYHFARTADDIADEGDASAGRASGRAATLYRSGLDDAPEALARWPQVFGPLRAQHEAPRRLPPICCTTCWTPLCRTSEKTRDGTGYRRRAPNCWTTAAAPPTRWAACCCTCTACRTRRPWHESDAICTALQLINFWQDLSVDIPAWPLLPAAGRLLTRFGVSQADILRAQADPKRYHN